MSSLQSLALRQRGFLPGGYQRDEGVNLIEPVSLLVKPSDPLSELQTKLMEPSQDASQLGRPSVGEESTDNTQELLACMDLVANERDRAAFMKIFQHFAPKVKGFLVNRGLNQQTADDVLQEAMLAVWQKAHNFDQAKAGLSTWIFTIARYKYIDRLRHDGRRKTEQDDEPDLRASDAPLSDDEVLEDQRKDAVQSAISRLPADQQTVIFLSFIKGLSHSEIAAQLDMPLGTVKSRIRRAFGQLREELGEVM
jgi:RNA polymerase sigma-70 factor (ECF subfamily)